MKNAIKQLRVELAFERRNAFADRRLSDEQLFRSVGKRAGVGDADKGL